MKMIAKILVYTIFIITIVLGLYFFWHASDLDRMGLFLIWVYIVLGITVLLIFVLPLLSTTPKAFKKMALSVGFVVVVVGISYLLVSDAQTAGTKAMQISPSGTTMKFVDIYVISTYIMLGITLLAIAFSSVLNSIRNR
jgi:hypothetical protein